MTLYPPLWMQPQNGDSEIEYSALTDRQLILSLWDTEGPVFGLKVSQRGAGANMSVDVSGGQAVITGNDASPQGTYFVSSDETENLEIPAPPGSGSRKHRVIAWVRDRLYDGTLDDDTYDWVLHVMEDTGSGTPEPPPSAITLAYVTVSAGQISVQNEHIEDRRLNALSRPGRARITADVAARPAVPARAEELWREDIQVHEVWDGGAWREIPHRDGGGSAWSTYTPTLTATVSNPNMGSGATRQGRYIRYGRTVTVEVILIFGSGMSAGSGFYEISLPVTARTQANGRRTGSAYTWDNSGSGDFADGVAFINSGATDRVRLSIDSSVVGHNAPWAWAANDEIGLTITYEAAS